jgi:1-deoxy-D-xylulose-5-phosphate synthase
MKAALAFALDCGKSVAIRYPKDIVPDNRDDLQACKKPFELGKSVTVRHGGSDIVIVAFGSILLHALKAADILAEQGIDVSVINARFAKPIDENLISLLNEQKTIITVEDHSLSCGFGSALLELAADKTLENAGSGAKSGKIITLGGPDEYVEVGPRSLQCDQIGIGAERIVETVKKLAEDN